MDDRQMDGWTDGWMTDEYVDRKMERWVDSQPDRVVLA